MNYVSNSNESIKRRNPSLYFMITQVIFEVFQLLREFISNANFAETIGNSINVIFSMYLTNLTKRGPL